MNNYFYNMVDPDEMTTLEYIPTIPKFLEFIKKQYSDYPAISDKVTTYTYAVSYTHLTLPTIA